MQIMPGDIVRGNATAFARLFHEVVRTTAVAKQIYKMKGGGLRLKGLSLVIAVPGYLGARNNGAVFLLTDEGEFGWSWSNYLVVVSPWRSVV